MRAQFTVILALVSSLVTACAQQQDVLTGTRLTLDGDEVTDTTAENRAPALGLPRAVTNTNWTHQARTPSHAVGHVALGETIAPQWAISIGQGNGRRNRITSSPVVMDGTIYALDGYATVTAVSDTGVVAWSQDLTPNRSDAGQASGGGVAVGGDYVVATTGYGEAVGLNRSTGDIIWRQDLVGFGGSAPTIYGGIVYVASRDGAAWAIEAKTGKIRWQIFGAEKIATRSGGPGPLVTDRWAVFPFGTGELRSTYRKGGLERWSAIVTGGRRGPAVAQFQDITGDPVLHGGTIYVGNSSGRMAAIDADDGGINWTAKRGVSDHIVVAGGSLFYLDDRGVLVRASRSTGADIWAHELPLYTTDKPNRRRGVHAHYGPILAGGQLYVASSDENMRVFDPKSGELLQTIPLDSAATGSPVVAGGALYVVTSDGQLRAFR